MASKCALLVFVAAIATGCAGYSRLDANWGTTQPDLVRSQIKNPEGVGPEVDPGENLDGQTVQTAVDKFRHGQNGRRAQPSSVINIGAVGK